MRCCVPPNTVSTSACAAEVSTFRYGCSARIRESSAGSGGIVCSGRVSKPDATGCPVASEVDVAVSSENMEASQSGTGAVPKRTKNVVFDAGSVLPPYCGGCLDSVKVQRGSVV